MSQKKLENMHGLPWTQVDEIDGEMLWRLHYHRELSMTMEPGRRRAWCSELFDGKVTLEQWDLAIEHFAVQDALRSMELSVDIGFRPEPPPLEDPTVFGTRYQSPARRYYMPSASCCPGCGRHTCWMGSEWKRFDTWANGREKVFSISPGRRSDDSIELELNAEGKVWRYRWIRWRCKPKELPWILVDFSSLN